MRERKKQIMIMLKQLNFIVYVVAIAKKTYIYQLLEKE